jgi:hypothetical protein
MDKWFAQIDILPVLQRTKNLNEEWTTVYESRESPLELLTLISIPIQLGRIRGTMKTSNWDFDMDCSSPKLLSGSYLSISFCQRFAISLHSNSYQTISRNVIAKREFIERAGTQSIAIQVKTEAILSFLEQTKRCMLIGLRSHRFSERPLSEFGLKVKKTDFCSSRANYFLQFLRPPSHQVDCRPRAKSMSILFGKAMVLSPSNLRPNQRLKLIPLKNASGQAE